MTSPITLTGSATRPSQRNERAGANGTRTNARIPWIDALRVVAAFGVVQLHVTFVVIRESNAASVDWWIGNFADASFCWCVPVFVMISGGLLLPKAGSTSLIEFYQRRFTRISLPVAFWSVFFIVFTWGISGQVDLRGTAEALLLGRPYSHMWFLFALVGLYAIAPFLAVFLSAATRKVAWGAVVVGFVIFSLHDMLSLIRGWRPDVFVLWMPYVPYFLAGHLIIREDRPLFSRRFAAPVFVFSVILIALLAGLLVPILQERSWRVMYAYLNPLVILSSISVICIAHSSSGTIVDNALIRRVSPLMLGVYVVHPVWIEALGRMGISPVHLSPIVGIPACSLAVFVLSLLSCWLIAWVPLGRRLVT